MPAPDLKYPPINARIRQYHGKTQIYDAIRKRWIILSPEEWVRQHVIYYLVNVMLYPASMMSIEKELILNDTKKRYDVVVYDKHRKPCLVVECKAPYIVLDTSVLEQALRYNLILKAPLLMLTNGVEELVFDSQNKSCALPAYGSEL